MRRGATIADAGEGDARHFGPASDMRPLPRARARCRSLVDLQTLVEGSVIMDEDGETELVPIGTEAYP